MIALVSTILFLLITVHSQEIDFRWSQYHYQYVGAGTITYKLRRRSVIVKDQLPVSNLKGQSITGYYVQILVGTPAQKFNVVVDTGSSNLAVAGRSAFSKIFFNKEASSTVDLTNSVEVETMYTESSWKGNLLHDLVSIPSTLVNISVYMPVTEITSQKNFFINNSKWQGILGLGYTSLVQPMNKNVPSVMKSIVTSLRLQNIFAMQLCSNSVTDSTYGSLIIGGFDSSLSVGKMYWTNITREWFYEILITGVMVGNTTIDLPCSAYNQDKTIVDSGTTNLRFPTLVYRKILALIKKYVKPHEFDDEFYNATKRYCTSVPHELDSWFPTLNINIPHVFENQTIQLTIYPSSYIQNVGQDDGKTCYQFSIYPSTSGSVLGTVVMQQYYVVFDREKKRIGFAMSKCFQIDKRLSVFSSIGLIRNWINPATCHSTDSDSTVNYILIAVVVLVLLFAVLVLGYGYWVKRYLGTTCCRNEENRYAELNSF